MMPRRSEDDPPPLLRNQPLLTYPGVRTGLVLDALEKALQKLILDYFNRLLAVASMSKHYHGTKENVSQEYNRLDWLIKQYLTLTLSQPIPWGQTVIEFIAAPPLKIGPTFRSLAETQLYKALGREIDGKEALLTDQQHQITHTRGGGFFSKGPEIGSMFIYLDMLAEHLAWRRIVRLAIATCLIRAFDYRTMWGVGGW
jgi:hypothetical protein